MKLPFPYLLLPLTVTSEEEEATDRQKSFLLGKSSHNCQTLLGSLKLKWPKGILIFLQAGSWKVKVVGLFSKQGRSCYCIKKNHHGGGEKLRGKKSGTFVNGLPRSINLSYLASFSSSPSQFFFCMLCLMLQRQKSRMCPKSGGDLVQLMMMAAQSFVMPKKSLLEDGQKQAFYLPIGNEPGWACPFVGTKKHQLLDIHQMGHILKCHSRRPRHHVSTMSEKGTKKQNNT